MLCVQTIYGTVGSQGSDMDMADLRAINSSACIRCGRQAIDSSDAERFVVRKRTDKSSGILTITCPGCEALTQRQDRPQRPLATLVEQLETLPDELRSALLVESRARLEVERQRLKVRDAEASVELEEWTIAYDAEEEDIPEPIITARVTTNATVANARELFIDLEAAAQIARIEVEVLNCRRQCLEALARLQTKKAAVD